MCVRCVLLENPPFSYPHPLPFAKSDVFRYVVVLAQGGVYADIDVTASTPVDEWVPMAGEYPPAIDFVVGFEAVRERETERQRDRETERQRDRETETETETETDIDRERGNPAL